MKRLLVVFSVALILAGVSTAMKSSPIPVSSAVVPEETKAPASPQKNSKPQTQKIEKTESSDFHHYLNDTLAELPTIEEVENNNDVSPHSPPKALFSATDRLGEIRKSILQDPDSLQDKLTEAAQFYESCAQRDGVLVAIRSLCLRNLIDASIQLNRTEIDLNRFPTPIVRIAQRLPPEPFHVK